MVFDDNDLIQANATIISGVLILLSLASLSRTSSLPLLDRTMANNVICFMIFIRRSQQSHSHPSAMFTVPSLARAGDYSNHHDG